MIALALFGVASAARAQTTTPPTGDEDAGAPAGGEETTEEGAEPSTVGARTSAPAAPTLTPEASASLGVAPGEAATSNEGDENVRRTLIPPVLLIERTPTRSTTVVFPLFYRDRRGDATSLLIPPYFQYRSPTARTHVLFPLFFHWRGQREEGGTWGTDIVPPFYYHSWQGRRELHGRAFGVAPLFFYGESFNADGDLLREHLIIPPLLTVHTWTPEHAFTLAGPFFYDRLRDDTDWGVAPLFFVGNNLHRRYLFIPPLLTWHSYNRDESRSLTVVGPFWHTRSPEATSVNLAPLFFHRHDRTSNRTTLAPLFHYDAGPYGRTIVTPLFMHSRRGENTTFVSWLYQNHRGRVNWDAVAPLFYRSHEPATGAHTEAFFPLFYHRATANTNTWWITPTFHYEREGSNWFFNFYPLLFLGRSGPRSHSLIGPFYARFRNQETQSDLMMVTPLFWRYTEPGQVTQLVGNFLWMSSVTQGVRSYEWHLLPIFSFARPRPQDLSWNVLFGLFGYRRAGTHRQLRLLWMTIDREKKFGIGLMGGYPEAGLSFNYFASDAFSLRVQPLWRFEENYSYIGGRVNALLWLRRMAVFGQNELRGYVGAGARGGYFYGRYTANLGQTHDTGGGFGIEGTAGLGLLLGNGAFDVNAEFTPILDVFDGDGTQQNFRWSAGLNAHWYF